MITRLEQAFTEASKLPLKEQNALADWVLAEPQFEEHWDKLFARSQKALSKLAPEALAELRSGQAQATFQQAREAYRLVILTTAKTVCFF